jgi:hypothetical protein
VNSVQVLLLGVISLDFEPDATGDVIGEGRGLGVASTTTQLIDKDTLESPHNEMTCPTSAREPNGISSTNGGSLDAKDAKPALGSNDVVRPLSTQTANAKSEKTSAGSQIDYVL